MSDLLSIDQALAAIVARVVPLEGEPVGLDDAYGRVLASSATSAVDLPPFASSAMDGYAVRTSDTPGTLTVVGSSVAGRPADRMVEPGEAIAVATGGMVPAGADAVVPIEHVVQIENVVTIANVVAFGANVRPRGGDVEAEGVVVPAATRLTPAHIGALAAAGVTLLDCARIPRVRILTTGTELRRPGAPLAAGEIYESNGLMLDAVLRATGAVVERLEAVPDDVAAHHDAIRVGLEADVLVTSGGVSVGPHDLVRRVASDLGVEEVFWGVALRPGKPLAFGVRGRTLVFGLPGNPVSSLVGAMLFVRPALLALQGATAIGPPWARGSLATPLRRSANRDELARARSEAVGTDIVLTPVSGQESHMIVRAATADALVHVPRGDGELAPGAAVRYLLLD